MALLFGFVVKPAFSQVFDSVGKTEEQSSQLVFWYDNVNDIIGQLELDRETFIQVTNASSDPVAVHVQILFSHNGVDPFNPADDVICAEFDFDDFYTPFDTHVYDLTFIIKNDPTNPINVGDVFNTKGFVVITPINNAAERKAISHQHLFGTSYIFDNGAGTEYILSAMGRDAVSFTLIPPGFPVPDGTILDGVDSGYVVLQPDVLKFNFAGFPDLFFEFSDVVSIAFRDNYNGSFGGYTAEPSSATWTGFIFDEFENQVSGCNAVQNCFFDFGLNEVYRTANIFLSGGFDRLLCPNNFFEAGWVKIDVAPLTDFDNEIGIYGNIEFGNFFNIDLFEGFGGAKYMHVE